MGNPTFRLSEVLTTHILHVSDTGHLSIKQKNFVLHNLTNKQSILSTYTDMCYIRWHVKIHNTPESGTFEYFIRQTQKPYTNELFN